MLAFTDDQIKSMTKDALLLPFVINDTATGYVAQKALLFGAIAGLETTDNGIKVFSDFYETVQQKYHQELSLLNNSQRTTYSDADLVAGGKSTGPHFPAGGWNNFTPKIINSVTGLPVTTLTNNLEGFHSDKVTMLVGLLKNGFNDGAFSMSINISGNYFSSTTGLGSLAANQRIIVTSGSNIFLAKVTGVSSSTVSVGEPPVSTTTTTATFELIYGTLFSGSANAQTSSVAFSDSQRNGSVTTAPNTTLYNFLINGIDALMIPWKQYITDMKAVIDANFDLQPRKAHNTAASAACETALTTITTWQAKPLSTTGGRFTNTHIAPIEALPTTRTSYTSARITEIVSDVGTVVQAADGTFTAIGAYGELFKNIDMRIARGAGSLAAVNNASLGVNLIDKKIATANDQLTQYNNTFAITKISADTIMGQIDFTVESATGFSVSDSVKVMDNNGSVYTRTISLITGNVIRVNSGVPAVLTTGGMARIVKLK